MSDTNDHRSTFYRTLNEARLVDARAAVQAGLYINGLATTATLALLAGLAVKPETANLVDGHAPRAFVWGLGFFGSGVFSAALAAVFSYLANHGYAEKTSPFRTLTPFENAKLYVWAILAHFLGYGACFGSLLAFAGGVIATVIGFDKIG